MKEQSNECVRKHWQPTNRLRHLQEKQEQEYGRCSFPKKEEREHSGCFYEF